jgi:hypothetical protein
MQQEEAIQLNPRINLSQHVPQMHEAIHAPGPEAVTADTHTMLFRKTTAGKESSPKPSVEERNTCKLS